VGEGHILLMCNAAVGTNCGPIACYTSVEDCLNYSQEFPFSWDSDPSPGFLLPLSFPFVCNQEPAKLPDWTQTRVGYSIKVAEEANPNRYSHRFKHQSLWMRDTLKPAEQEGLCCIDADSALLCALL
jgi:hypothetical protein